MSLAIVQSRASAGVNALPVAVEVHLSVGLPGFAIVGLPEAAVKESKDRVRSAILNSQFEFPAARIIVNLAPADLPKEGGRFDLAIALGILAASDQIPKAALDAYEFAGELALTGELRSFKGALPFAIATHEAKKQLIVPMASAAEAALSEKITVFGAKHLLEVCAHLRGLQKISALTSKAQQITTDTYPDLQDVKGQAKAKRALEIAAAGGHSLLMIGSPGTGKTMLASRLPGILSLISEEQALEVAAVYSIAKTGFDVQAWRRRPFRAPHHTASSVAMVGGGRPPSPGEISLAHRGVLFLDELPEYSRHVLESLREPLESGEVTISRASYQVQFPAKFQLVAAMNPCPCGYLGDRDRTCRCTQDQVQRYENKLSGPLLDRIDMHVNMLPIDKRLLIDRNQSPLEETSDQVRQRVILAQQRQLVRQKVVNAHLSSADVSTHCMIHQEDYAFVEQAMNTLGLSARALHRILKVARTLADLGKSEAIARQHLQEALSFRSLH